MAVAVKHMGSNRLQQAAGVVAVEGSAARLRAAPEPGEAIQAMGVAWTAAEAQASSERAAHCRVREELRLLSLAHAEAQRSPKP